MGRATAAVEDGAGGGGAAALTVPAAIVASPVCPVVLGVEGDIVQAMAAVRKSTAPRAGSHIGVVGSGRGWS